MALRNRKLEMGNKPVKGVADAVDAKDAVNKGQLDAAIAGIDLTSRVPTSRLINTTSGELTGGGDLTADRTLGLADTAVTPATYTLATVTVDAKGRVTSASSGTPPPPTPWRTVETKSSASGSVVFFNDIPQDATDLRLLFDGVSNVTTTQPLRIELSTDNGSSYGPPSIITSNQINTTALHGYFEIKNFTRSNSVKIGQGVLFQGVALAANQSGFGYNLSAALIDAVNALRLTWGSGDYDAGSITLQVL